MDTKYCTIEGFETLTPQQVFDMSASHLLRQGKKSMSPAHDVCRYRGEGGTKCAAGVFLNDADAEKCEGATWFGLARSGGPQMVPTTNLNLITSLQMIHDHWDPSEWRFRLVGVAAEHQLDASQLATPTGN